jgi:hypothetical protein
MGLTVEFPHQPILTYVNPFSFFWRCGSLFGGVKSNKSPAVLFIQKLLLSRPGKHAMKLAFTGFSVDKLALA